MFKFLKLGVLRRGVQTKLYPQEPAEPYDAFFGLPVVDGAACDRCSHCVSVCPVQAITLTEEGVEISTARCIFCGDCADACPKAIKMSRTFELSASSKEDLKVVYRYG